MLAWLFSAAVAVFALAEVANAAAVAVGGRCLSSDV